MSKEIFVQGIIVGVVSSSIFLLVSYLVRPRFYICDRIIDVSGENEPKFQFKIINLGLMSMVDVELELELITSKMRDDALHMRIQSLKLARQRLARIPPIRPAALDNSRSYAVRFLTFEDLNASWTNSEQRLRLSVKAKHPITGFSRLVTRNFHYTNQRPVKGSFKDGWKPGIVPAD